MYTAVLHLLYSSFLDGSRCWVVVGCSGLWWVDKMSRGTKKVENQCLRGTVKAIKNFKQRYVEITLWRSLHFGVGQLRSLEVRSTAENCANRTLRGIRLQKQNLIRLGLFLSTIASITSYRFSLSVFFKTVLRRTCQKRIRNTLYTRVMQVWVALGLQLQLQVLAHSHKVRSKLCNTTRSMKHRTKQRFLKSCITLLTSSHNSTHKLT